MSDAAGSSLGPGDLVADRYEIVSLLGHGGMGEVYVARDRKLRRRVALKTMLAGGVDESQGAERLRAEAETLAQLDHPGIVAVHDVVEEQGRVHVVMELIDGVSLRKKLRSGPLPPLEVAEIVTALASALGAAHAHGQVHRDVKPDNVMIRADGRVALLDFGIAKTLETGAMGRTLPAAGLTEPGAIVGTPLYLSPEQARGDPVSPATDQFSLAVTAYELLSGTIPWPTESTPRLLAAILRDEPCPIATRLGLDAAADRVLARALSKDPAQRYPSVQGLAEALTEAIASASRPRPSSPRPGGVPVSDALDEPRGPRVAARRRSSLLGMAVAGALVVAGGLLGRRLFDAPRASPSPPPPASASSAPPSFRLDDLPPSRTRSAAAEASTGKPCACSDEARSRQACRRSERRLPPIPTSRARTCSASSGRRTIARPAWPSRAPTTRQRPGHARR